MVRTPESLLGELRSRRPHGVGIGGRRAINNPIEMTAGVKLLRPFVFSFYVKYTCVCAKPM